MKARLIDLGTMAYADCWSLQQRLFDALVARKSRPAEGTAKHRPENGAESGAQSSTENDAKNSPESGAEEIPLPAADSDDAGTILLVEHPPVYTLGKSGHAENLLVDRTMLERLGAQFFHIDRGGDITFHGPGQLVVYPILDLERIGIGLRDYIGSLEESVIRTVAEYGITAGRIAGASGVWIDEHGRCPRKICAIGVRSSRYITMHGMALNAETDLRWFSRINPCGFTDRGVTSIARETGRPAPIDEVKRLVAKHLTAILNVEIYK